MSVSLDDLERMAATYGGSRVDIDNYGEPTKSIHIFEFPYKDDARDFIAFTRSRGCVTNGNPDTPLRGGFTVEVVKSSLGTSAD